MRQKRKQKRERRVGFNPIAIPEGIGGVLYETNAELIKGVTPYKANKGEAAKWRQIMARLDARMEKETLAFKAEKLAK